MENNQSDYGQVALKFASALAHGDFDQAHRCICEKHKSDWSAAQLRTAYEGMIEYGDGSANFVEVMETMTDWPTRVEGDLGWVYVAIAGDDFSEAVAVIVSEDDGEQRIREIEWGRP